MLTRAHNPKGRKMRLAELEPSIMRLHTNGLAVLGEGGEDGD